MQYFVKYPSPVGELLLTGDGKSLTGLWMESQSVPTASMEPGDDLPLFRRAEAWLDRYFRGERPEPEELPLSPAGTPFQLQVWELLKRIPYGQTRTYGDIAREMSVLMKKDRMSAQAAGGAVSRNPISIIIPCHRVIGAQGQLTGYAGGISRKLQLLRHEGYDHQEETL